MARTISSPGAPSSDALNFFSSPAPPPRPSAHAPPPRSAAAALFSQHQQLPPLFQQTSFAPPPDSDDLAGMDAQDLSGAMFVDGQAPRPAFPAQPLGGEQPSALLPRRIILKTSGAPVRADATLSALSETAFNGEAGAEDAQGETDDEGTAAGGEDGEPEVEIGRGHDDDGTADGQGTTDADDHGDDDDSGESEIEVQNRPAASAANGRRSSARRSAPSYAEDDEDDDDGQDDASLAFLASASPRVSRSGRVSKPPAHLAKQVTSMNFTDDEIDEDDEPQPKRNRKGKGKRCVGPSLPLVWRKRHFD